MAFSADRLWVVSAEGALFSYDPELETYRTHAMSARMTQVLGGDGYADAVEDFGGVGIHHLDVNGREGSVPTLIKEDPRAVVKGESSVAVLSSHHVVFSEQPTKRLPIEIPGDVTAVAMTRNGTMHVATREGNAGHLQKFVNVYASPYPEPAPLFRITTTPPITAMTTDPQERGCLWAAWAPSAQRPSSFGRICSVAQPEFGTSVDGNERISALAVGQRGVLALGDRIHILTEPPRTIPIPRTAPRCGLEVISVDDFLIFPTTAKDPFVADAGANAVRYLVVAKD